MVQGLGASLMTPQTMSLITLMFPPNARGVAMSILGCDRGYCRAGRPNPGRSAGGYPQLGLDLLHQYSGRHSGYVSGVAVMCRVFEQKKHSFDWLGVVLSAIGLFLLVFGIQEGTTYDWGIITDSFMGTGIAVSVWGPDYCRHYGAGAVHWLAGY